MKEFQYKDAKKFLKVFNNSNKNGLEMLNYISIESQKAEEQLFKEFNKRVNLNGLSVHDHDNHWIDILVEDIHQVWFSISVMNKLGEYSKKINSSYKLKHQVEKLIDKSGLKHRYISNGALIMACMLMGYRFKVTNEINVFINLKFKNIDRLEER